MTQYVYDKDSFTFGNAAQIQVAGMGLLHVEHVRRLVGGAVITLSSVVQIGSNIPASHLSFGTHGITSSDLSIVTSNSCIAVSRQQQSRHKVYYR
jgi:hypothetical protein